MLSGVAVAYSNLPVEVIERHGLAARVYERGGEAEVRFLLTDRDRSLPVCIDGGLRIVRWGNRRGQSRGLPCTAWTCLETLEKGGWGDREVVPVVIAAALGLDRGVWFRVREGVRGVVVLDEKGASVVYVLCAPATHYYQVMTRSEWMPVLVGESI
jgi:hypothetical protein